jgi:hypothetical protein
MKGVIVGRTVHYVLTEMDVEKIIGQRTIISQFGGVVRPGDHVPMVFVKVFPVADPMNDPGMVNGQCFLDGNDTLWVTSRMFDENEKCPGTWHWIEKAL